MEERLFRSQGGEFPVDAHLRLSASSHSGLQPTQEANQGDTVANHRLPEALLFGFSLDSLHGRNGGGVTLNVER